MTFFASEPKFPIVPEDNKVETEAFLKAAKNFPTFFDSFGAAFKPVKSDIEGNIVKLNKVYEKDPDKSKTFYGMLENEIATNTSKNKEAGTIALIWLIRGFEYTLVVLKELLQDKKTGNPSENIRPFCQKAYESTLKMYHGWFVQKVFSLASHAAPYRKDLIKGMAKGDESLEEQVYIDMEEFINTVEAQVTAIKWMYGELKIDTGIMA